MHETQNHQSKRDQILVLPPNLNDTVSVLSRRERDTQKEKTNMQKRNGIYKGK